MRCFLLINRSTIVLLIPALAHSGLNIVGKATKRNNMETLEIGDHVYHERNDTVMVVKSVDQDLIQCTWRDSEGKQHEDMFPISALKKMSVGGISSSTDGRIDPGAKG
jgi:hypothetical protein